MVKRENKKERKEQREKANENQKDRKREREVERENVSWKRITWKQFLSLISFPVQFHSLSTLCQILVFPKEGSLMTSWDFFFLFYIFFRKTDFPFVSSWKWIFSPPKESVWNNTRNNPNNAPHSSWLQDIVHMEKGNC